MFNKTKLNVYKNTLFSLLMVSTLSLNAKAMDQKVIFVTDPIPGKLSKFKQRSINARFKTREPIFTDEAEKKELFKVAYEKYPSKQFSMDDDIDVLSVLMICGKEDKIISLLDNDIGVLALAVSDGPITSPESKSFKNEIENFFHMGCSPEFSKQILKLADIIMVDTTKAVAGYHMAYGMMHFAVDANDFELVKYLSENFPHTLNTRSLDDITAAQVAAENNNLEILKYFCENFPEMCKGVNKFGMTLGHSALRFHGKLETVSYICEKFKENVEAKTSRGLTIWHMAVKRGDVNLLAYMCETYPDLIFRLNHEDKDFLSYALVNNEKSYNFIKDNYPSLYVSARVEDSLSTLEKTHDSVRNDHVPAYETLLQAEKLGEKKASAYLNNLRKYLNSRLHPKERSAQQKAKTLFKQAEESYKKEHFTLSQTSSQSNPISKKQKKKNPKTFPGESCAKLENKPQASLQSEPKEPTSLPSSVVHETSLSLLHGDINATSASSSIDVPLVPLQTVSPEIKTSVEEVDVLYQHEGLKQKSKEPRPEKEKKKSTWKVKTKELAQKIFPGTSKKEDQKEEVTHRELVLVNTEVRASEIHENEEKLYNKVMKYIYKTPTRFLFDTFSLSSHEMIQILRVLHKQGRIDLRNVQPLENGSFKILDNKIVATRKGNGNDALVLHTHNDYRKWWKKPENIKDYVRFLQNCTPDYKAQFENAMVQGTNTTTTTTCVKGKR